MTNTVSSFPEPIVVAWPRAGDSIGTALRDVYCGGARLPEDMAALLLKLNGNGYARERA